MKNLKDIPETELRAYAKEQAQTVTVRTFHNGNSNDTKRLATPTEAHIIETIMHGALLAIRSGYNEKDVINGAEYIAIVQLNGSHEDHINTYDSVYLPLKNYLVNE